MNCPMHAGLASFVIQQALHALDSSLVLSGILQRGITSHHIKRLAESRVGASCLYREQHETDPGDADTPSRNTNDCLGESLSEDPIRMRGISHIFNVTCRWLRSLLKNNEEPSVPEERWSFQGFRDIDEARRLKCGLEPLVSTTNFGFMSKQAQARMETSLNLYLSNSSPFKSDIGSLRGKIECLDTQRAREVDFFEFKVLSDQTKMLLNYKGGR